MFVEWLSVRFQTAVSGSGFEPSCIQLDFLFTDLSQHFRICLVVFALKYFIYRHGQEAT